MSQIAVTTPFLTDFFKGTWERLLFVAFVFVVYFVLALVLVLWPFVALAVGVFWWREKDSDEVWTIYVWLGAGSAGLIYPAAGWWFYSALPVLVSILLLLPYIAGVAVTIWAIKLFGEVLTSDLTSDLR